MNFNYDTSDRTVILASASKGRQGILDNLEIPYVSLPADIDETIPWLNPAVEIQNLALKKARAAHIQNSTRKENWIIAADTLVIFQGMPMGKPKDLHQAGEFLHMLSGNTHRVITGLACMNRTSGKILFDYETTEVYMGHLSDMEIGQYLSTGEWQGAAGAYRIQKKGASLVEKINGSFSNVIGLPIRKLFYIMNQTGYPV